MNLYCRRILSAVLIFATAITFSIPRDLLASENHLISPADLQRSIISAARARQEKIDNLKEFFASEIGRKVLRQAGVTSTKIENALPGLSNEELAQLSLKTQA